MPHDPMQTKICELFEIEYPIFAFTHCKDVAAAVTNAGGVGVIGAVNLPPDEIVSTIRWLRERVGNRPFGIDILFPASIPEAEPSDEELDAMIPAEHRAFVKSIMEKHGLPEPKGKPGRADGFRGGLFAQETGRDQLQAAFDERVPFIVSGLGSPAFAVEAAHERGIKIGGLVGKVRQARRELDAGVDVVIAQGYDAGGHTGEIGAFTLIPQVVAIAGETPVLAAGGITTGRHLAAALCLGAAGTWSGTLWLASRESDVDMQVKDRLIASTEEDTIRSRSVTGKPMRQLRNAWNMAWEEPGAPKPLPMPLQFMLSQPVTLAAQETHHDAFVSSPAGQGVGAIHAIKPCREIVFDMVSEARDVFDGLAPTPA